MVANSGTDQMLRYKILNFTFISLAFIAMLGCLDRSSTKGSVEWQELFNGKDLNGWTAKFYHHELGDNYAILSGW